MEEQFKKETRGSIPPALVIVIFLILVILIFGAIFFLSYSGKNKQGSPASFDSLSNLAGSLASYKNELYGYEIMYPADHRVFFNFENKVIASAGSETALIAENEKMPAGSEANVLKIKVINQKTTAKEFLEAQIKNNGWYQGDLKMLDRTSEIDFQGQKATELISTQIDPTSPYKLIMVERQNGLLVIGQGVKSEFLDKIIASFKLFF